MAAGRSFTLFLRPSTGAGDERPGPLPGMFPVNFVGLFLSSFGSKFNFETFRYARIGSESNRRELSESIHDC